MANLFSAEQQKSIYLAGFEQYASGSYAEASSLFSSLVLASPHEGKFWRALASSKQMEAKYEEALRAWALVSLQDDLDPVPHFHAAECLTAMEQREEALKALEMATRLLDNDRSEIGHQIARLKKINGGPQCA